MHGGWSGIIESLHYETPMLIMPLFADHYKNAKVIEKRNVGIIIDKLQMDRQTLTTAMNRLLADNR
jgi:UDP:flavonoid glycosyltransferase YjiC (YdhE family)